MTYAQTSKGSRSSKDLENEVKRRQQQQQKQQKQQQKQKQKERKANGSVLNVANTTRGKFTNANNDKVGLLQHNMSPMKQRLASDA